MTHSLVPRLGLIALRVLLGAVILVLLLLVGVVFAVELPPVRDFARERANRALEPLFVGNVTLERIGHVDFAGVGGVDATVRDRSGRRVLVVRGLDVDVIWPRIVWTALRGDTIDVRLDAVRLRHGEIALLDDGSGSPTLATTFGPRSKAKPSTSSSTEVRVTVSRIGVEHAWVHGRLADGPIIDGDLRRVAAYFAYDAKGIVTRLDRAELAFRSLPEGIEPRGTLRGSLSLPEKLGPRASGHFAGTIAGAETFAEGAWDGTSLSARVRAPVIPARTMTERVQGLALRDPLALEVAVAGKLSELRFDAKLAGKPLSLHVHGTAAVEAEKRLSARADAENDLSGLVAGAPPSTLATHADVALRLSDSGALDGEYRVEIPAGRLEGEVTPRFETSGRAHKSADGSLSLAGAARVDEPGAPTSISYRLTSKPGGRTLVHAELDSRVREPKRLVQMGVRASGDLSASCDFDSAASSLEARAKLRGDVLAHDVRAHAIELKAAVVGPAAAPRLDAELTAGPVDAVGRRFRAVALTASGRPSELLLHALLEGDAPRRIELASRASLQNGARFDETRVVLRDGEGVVEVVANAITLRAGRVRVDGLSLQGAGELEGNVDASARRQGVEVTANELEVERLARLVGVRVPFERARVSADIALVRDGAAVTGHARAKASEVRIGKLDDAGARIELELSRENVSGVAEADFGEGGRLHVELDRFELPRGAWTAGHLLRQKGSIVARGDLRLHGFYPLIEATGMPIERVDGTAKFDLSANGGDDARGPRVNARLETKGLRVVERVSRPDPIRTTKEARKLEPRALEGVDLRVELAIDPEEQTGRTHVVLFDPWGTILTLDGDTKLPPDWTRSLFSEWRTLPLRATLEVPRRPLELFPELVRPSAQKGVGSAHVELGGSVTDPKVDARVVFDALHVRDTDRRFRVSTLSHYERSRGNFSLAADVEGRSVGLFDATWRGDLARIASVAPGEQSPVVIDADGKIVDFPTELIPPLYDRQIKGPLRGEIHVKELGRNSVLSVMLDGSKMTFGQVRLDRLRADIEAGAGRARARLEAGDRSGNVEVDLQTKLNWRDRLAPEPPTTLEARLLARKFRLDSLSPALSRYVNEVGGRLDADLDMRLEPGHTVLKGTASVEKGVVQVPALGQRLTDIKARVSIDGDRVVIDRVAARGDTGRMTAKATARLDGLSLVQADAQLAIKNREKIPVTLEGASVGDAWGRVEVEYKRADEGTDLTVKVPSLHVELAEEGDLEVQSLDEVKSIHVGARLRDGTFAAIPVQPLETNGGDSEDDPSPMRVRVILGRDVEIRKGQMLTVQLRGQMTMTSDGESRVDGKLVLKGGKLDVQGKLFDIERGVVAFNGDPSNPTITATARWDSPAGYTVYADYTGDVKNGKITLHSEPPLTQDEIASLLMFGTPDGSAGASSGSTDAAATAVGVAGDTAARGINHALSNLTRLDVAARVDTSTGTARPELVVQVTPRVAARVTRAVGEPQAGQPPDQTFLTVEFRFTRSWSVSAVVGDHGGSGLDVIWRRRY